MGVKPSTLSCLLYHVYVFLAEKYRIHLNLFLHYPYSWNLLSKNQMVNTRRGSDQQGQNNQGTGIPMPPPLTRSNTSSSRCRWWLPWTTLFRHFSRLTLSLRLLHRRRPATGMRSFWGVTRRRSPTHLTHSRRTTGSMQWNTSWTSPSAMIGSVSCTQ